MWKEVEKNFKVREIQPYGAAVDASASIGCQLFILKSWFLVQPHNTDHTYRVNSLKSRLYLQTDSSNPNPRVVLGATPQHSEP